MLNSTKDHRAELMHWLALTPWHFFLTLNPNCQTSLPAIRTHFKHFCQRVDRKIVGPKYYDRAHRRTLIIALPEHLETNLHLHCLVLFRREMEVSRRMAKQVCLESWAEVIKSGTAKLKRIPTRYSLIQYVTKELSTAARYENLMLSSEFWP
jgi:hypothetical protein